MKEKPPKPQPKNLTDILDPLDDYAESWISQQFSKIFSLNAFRIYLMMFLGSYILSNSEINISLSDAKLNIELTTEFVLIVTLFSLVITMFSIVIYFQQKQKNKEKDNRVKSARVWQNYLRNIQPYLDEDPEKMVQMSLVSVGYLSSNEIEDFIVKIVGPDIRKNTEKMYTLDERLEVVEEFVDDNLWLLEKLKNAFKKKN